MDLATARQKLAESQNKGKKKTYEKVDYSKIYFKPQPGEYQIRILPSKFNKSNQFREIYFHYGFEKFPILALTNWGEKDPIDEFVKQLRKSKDPEDWELAKKIAPKLRYFVAVVVRGKESEGARLWEFGKLTYEKLLAIEANEDYGDYTDITDGRDLTVNFANASKMGRNIVEVTSIVPRVKTSYITKDEELLKNLLDVQPDVLSFNKKYTFDALKTTLEKWLEPTDDHEDEASGSETPVLETEEKDTFLEEMNAPVTPYAELPVTKTKATDKFDELFK